MFISAENKVITSASMLFIKFGVLANRLQSYCLEAECSEKLNDFKHIFSHSI